MEKSTTDNFILRHHRSLLASFTGLITLNIIYTVVTYFSLQPRVELTPVVIVIQSLLTSALILITTYVIVHAVKVKRNLGAFTVLGMGIIQATNCFVTLVFQYASTYWSHGTKLNFSSELSKLDALYFSLGNITSSGTGEINASSEFMRAIVSGQMMANFLFIITVIAALGLILNGHASNRK